MFVVGNEENKFFLRICSLIKLDGLLFIVYCRQVWVWINVYANIEIFYVEVAKNKKCIFVLQEWLF